MHSVLAAICSRLEELARRIEATSPNSTRTLREEVNWTFPALTRSDLAGLALRLRDKITAADLPDEDSPEIDKLSDVPRRLELLWGETLGNFNGNFQAVWAIMASLDGLDKALEPVLGLQRIDDPRYLPAKTAGRLRSVNRTMDRIENDYDDLLNRVEKINDAYIAAQGLPSTLQDLVDAQSTLEELRKKIENLYEESVKTQGKIESSASIGDSQLAEIMQSATKASDLVKRCEDAYQITTTKGLAGAFDQRANELKNSINWWVFLLLSALAVGGIFGSGRIEALSALTASGHPDWGVIVLHIVLSALTVGGPLWFAWLSTKQIGQRFRLAEDYAFKASVAKAYEGYRKQAENLDEAFSARLFGSALTRLDEAPLRLVEKETHGSPWHEASQSELIKTAIATVPGFSATIADMAKKALDAATTAVSSRFKPSEPPKAPTE